MKLSNLRLERKNKLENGQSVCLICDVECNFSRTKELYFSVDDKYADWLTDDVYDAFLVAAIYPAMYYNEPIEISGLVLKKIYHNVVNYVMAIVKDFAPSLHKVPIIVEGFKNASKNKKLHIGTGFSGGVDSFSTLQDRFFDTDDLDYKIDTLFFFHVGQYGDVKNPRTWERANNRFEITRSFANTIGTRAIMMNTNLFDFYLPDWEYKAGVLNRITSVLAFQKSLKRYYISNTYTYGEMIDLARDRVFLEEFADPYIMPLLSPENLEIVCDGAQYKRSEKTQRIVNNKLAQTHLNVCVNSSNEHVSATNCGICTKCLRTMMALDSIDQLDQFRTVFDIRQWKKHAWEYKCLQVYKYNTDGFARDNVDFANKHGKSLPFRPFAYLVVYVNWLVRLPFRVIRKIGTLYKK